MSEGRVLKDVFGNAFDPDERVHAKELQARLQVSGWYFSLMRLAQFPMPFGKASYNEALDWWEWFRGEYGREFSAKWVYRNRAKFVGGKETHTNA